LVPATQGLVKADLAGRAVLSGALGATVPDNWPPELYDRPAMEYAYRQLDDRAEQRWSAWYLVENRASGCEVVGICGFKGRPDAKGSAEIGYSILTQFRHRGLATEAVARLVQWAFSHPGVNEVSAETLPHLVQSIKVLENNGFARAGAGSERGVVRFALPRTSLN
jgi:RimJ/RimL family protein N-acetyltransferase